jgi:hypothetical protein
VVLLTVPPSLSKATASADLHLEPRDHKASLDMGRVRGFCLPPGFPVPKNESIAFNLTTVQPEAFFSLCTEPPAPPFLPLL